MVNWNSRMAKPGHKFPVMVEVIDAKSEGGILVVTARLVDLPVGVSTGNIILSGVPLDDDDDEDGKEKKKDKK